MQVPTYWTRDIVVWLWYVYLALRGRSKMMSKKYAAIPKLMEVCGHTLDLSCSLMYIWNEHVYFEHPWTNNLGREPI